MMREGMYKPPLRLVLTGKCNGNCGFCHNEGNKDIIDMPLSMVYGCINSAKQLGISKVSLTGGEPTLRDDLGDIIQFIQEKKDISLSLTSNGYALKKWSTSVQSPIDNLNISMYSLKKELAKKFQNVDPEDAIEALKCFPARKKTINIYITKENESEINDFISLAESLGASLDIMFGNESKDSDYKELQKGILDRLVNSYDSEMQLRSTSVLKFNVSEKTNVRVKHPYLSHLLHSSICENCDCYSSCFEKVCAIRVLPNGVVTPCLKKRICFDGMNIYEKIQKAYDSINKMTFCNEFYNMEYPLDKPANPMYNTHKVATNK